MAVGAAQSGNKFLVEIDGAVIGSQTGASFSENRDTIDISTKQDLGTKKFIAGPYSSTVTLSALFIDNDAAHDALLVDHRAGTEVILIKRTPEGDGSTIEDFESCNAICTSMTEDYPQDAVATIEATFQVNGGWTVL